MRALILDDMASIELAMEAKRRHLRDAVGEIARRSRPESLVAVAGERLGARTSEVFDAAKARFQGATGFWATLALGAAGVFELGRWSKSRARRDAGEPGEKPDEPETVRETTQNHEPVAVTLGFRAIAKAALLAALGLGGGFVVSALAPRVPGETEAARFVSDNWRRTVSEAVGANGSGLVRLLLTWTGVPRYASTVLMIVAIGEMLFASRPAPEAEPADAA